MKEVWAGRGADEMNGKLISIRSACEDPLRLGQAVLPGGKVLSGDAYLLFVEAPHG